MGILKDRTGEVSYNFYGSRMTIIKYNNNNDIIIQFDDGYTVQSQYHSFKDGGIRNPYDKSNYGIGYLGEGKYVTAINHKNTKVYKTWKSMIQRCYDDKFHETRPTYKDCIVCEEWLCFQNFAQWFEENYYVVNGERTALDKDILIKGNKIYSPSTCIFVPERINNLFTKTDALRGDLPIGVSLYKVGNYVKYSVNFHEGKRKVHLGYFNDPKEAFLVYKNQKEKRIKEVANTYKNKYPQFPQKLYETLMSYEVEITD